MIYDVLILGSGPAGDTAAIYTARAGLKTLLLAGVEKGGQLALTSAVENYPGFEKGILGPELMVRLEKQARRFGVEIINQAGTRVDFKAEPLRVYTIGEYQGGQGSRGGQGEVEYRGRTVIIATGAAPKELGVDGENRLRGRGVSYCAVCDGFFFKDKKAAVVGGGDWALEEALTLSKLASKVYLIHRRDLFRASKIMQERVFGNEKIEIIWNTKVLEILGKEKVAGVRLETKKATKDIKGVKNIEDIKKILKQVQDDGSGLKVQDDNGKKEKLIEDKGLEFIWRLPVEGVFAAVGHKPNTEFLKGQVDLDEKNYVKINRTDRTNTAEYEMMTSVPGVFAAGDVHDRHYRQAVTAAAFGCMAGLEVERWLREKGGEK